MKTLKSGLALVIVAAAACSAATPSQIDSAQNALTEGNNKFALELYQKLSPQPGNLFFSPYSISTALALAYGGARNRTAEQMADVLHFPTRCQEPNKAAVSEIDFHAVFGSAIRNFNEQGGKGAYELTVANALWGQKGYAFLPQYMKLVQTQYDSELQDVDFSANIEAARIINTWVAQKTKEKIKDLIQPGALNSLTRLVLTNAIYFKGKWASQFSKDTTRQEPFFLADAGKADVPMMNQKEHFKYAEDNDCQVLEMPYVGDELSMIILLPKDTKGIDTLEKNLTADALSGRLAKLRKDEVSVFIPRFKVTSQFGLNDVLASMGMKDAFSPNAADFSGMTGNRELFISAVVHKAYVDVNEEGTEAAAATGVVMSTTAIRQVPVFRADHPFIYLIRDNVTGSILFLGRMANPAN